MSSPHFSLQEAKHIDIVDYLEELGYQPQKIRNNDYWYLSPLREEKEPSFKVNRKLNLYYDYGTGKGGSIIDFGISYHKCSIPEFIQKLSESFSFHRKRLSVQQPLPNTQKPEEALEPKIKVIAAKPLTNPILCRYLSERKIPFEIAEKYCKEVYFELNGRQNFAIGFENKSGGFELRNSLFKGSSSPKDVTQISAPEAKDISVVEGFFSFLSYQTLPQNKSHQLTNFLVLNSLSFFKKSRELMEQNDKVYLYLDRDEAGIKNTQTAFQWDKKYIDRSHLYKNHKDLNDYLLSQKPVKRNKLIGVRCSVTERFVIEAKAKAAGLTLSEYLRISALNGKIDMSKRVIPKEVLQGIGSLSHLAANVNQIAKKRNGFDELNALERAQLQHVVGQLLQFIKDFKNYFK